MGIILSWFTPSFCSKVDEKKKISRQIDKEILQELKQEAGMVLVYVLMSTITANCVQMRLTCCCLEPLRRASPPC